MADYPVSYESVIRNSQQQVIRFVLILIKRSLDFYIQTSVMPAEAVMSVIIAA